MSARVTAPIAGLGRTIAGWVAPSLCAALFAFVTAFYGIQRGQATTEQRLTTPEQNVERIREQTVPRAEHERQWAADKEFRELVLKRFDELKADMRELKRGSN